MPFELPESVLENIGKHIKNLREKQGLTQVELALKAGIHPDYYPRLERGEANFTMDKLYKVVKALKVKSSDLLPF